MTLPVSKWISYYCRDPERYRWDLMWNGGKVTGAVAHPHPKIYLGDPASVIPPDVTAVVNVAAEIKNRSDLGVNIEQYKSGVCGIDSFCGAVFLIGGLVKSDGHTVLVHCMSGISRSVSVVATITAMLNRSTVVSEIVRIASERPEICPEPCYVIFGEMLNGEFKNEGDNRANPENR